MASCGPNEVSVRDYWRTAPRRKAKPRTPATYYTCHHGRQTCGVKHTSMAAALRHSKRLDRAARKAGRRTDWQPEKVTA